MDPHIEKLQQHVNLESYSDSPGFAGFFEKPDRYDERLISKAIGLFFDYFDSEIRASTIVFAYSTSESATETACSYDLNEEAVSLLALLQERQRITIEGPQGDLESVSVEQLSRDETLVIVSARLKLGEFIGPCFILLSELDLILYPHEDIGFGAICTGPAGEETADKFLCEASRLGFAAYKSGCDPATRL